MVMTYVGSLKSLIYRTLVFPFFDPSAASVRIPAIVIGSISVWAFYRLLLRVLGTRAALIGAALLATDAMYLLTIRIDWGPVALQHLCLIAGVLAIVRFAQERRMLWLGIGFFVFGLGLWDKAVFIWTLAALGISTSLVFPRFLRELLRPRNAAVAVLAFGLGALPLIIFNVRHNWSTFTSNVQWSTQHFGHKLGLLWGTVRGTAMFGMVAREDWDGPPRKPETAGERALVRLNTAIGMPRNNLLGYLLIASLLMLPLARYAGRPVAFVSIFGIILWLQMAFTEGAGTGAHHTILLWPAPQFLIAAALSRWRTSIVAGAVTLACIANLALTSTYYTNMIRNGGALGSTEASWPASEAIKAIQPRELCVLDWGFFEIIRLLHQGRTPLCVIGVITNEQERRYILAKLQDESTFFIAHTEGNEFEQGSLKRFLDFASKGGYVPASVRIFEDLNGRRLIQLFRFERKM
jgi:hypothetical protein